MSAGNIVKSLCEFFVYKSPPRVGNFFPLPNDIFNLDLCAGEIALYSYLMRMEDRKTYSCYPSFKTIGNDSVESLKTLEDSLQNWLQVFKFPAVERTTYDRAESIAKNQIYPQLGKKIVGDITAADIKKLLNYWMTEGYAYTTVKKIYVLLNEFFRHLYQQKIIVRNPMANVEMLKKANFMSAQGKENLPPTETITVFSEEEIEKFKAEAFSTFGNGK